MDGGRTCWNETGWRMGEVAMRENSMGFVLNMLSFRSSWYLLKDVKEAVTDKVGAQQWGQGLCWRDAFGKSQSHGNGWVWRDTGWGWRSSNTSSSFLHVQLSQQTCHSLPGILPPLVVKRGCNTPSVEMTRERPCMISLSFPFLPELQDGRAFMAWVSEWLRGAPSPQRCLGYRARDGNNSLLYYAAEILSSFIPAA